MPAGTVLLVLSSATSATSLIYVEPAPRVSPDTLARNTIGYNALDGERVENTEKPRNVQDPPIKGTDLVRPGRLTRCQSSSLYST